MRWLFGVILGLFVLFAGFFLLEYTARFDQMKALLNEGAVSELPVDAPDPVVKTEPIETTEPIVSESLKDEITYKAAGILPFLSTRLASNDVEVFSGSQTVMEPSLPSVAQTEMDLPANDIPENIQLIISETADFRLSMDSLAMIPQEAVVAIWPDSPLTKSDQAFYLMNPPNDIMNSYKLKEVVNDDADLYAKAFNGSAGIFVRDLNELAEVSEFSRLIYAQMAQKRKSLVVYNSYYDPNLNELLRETQADFRRVNYIFEQDSQTVSLEKQWQAMLTKARHGEEIIVLYELQESGLEPLDNVIASTN